MESKELTRYDANLSMMPIIFYGSSEEKEALEKRIFETKQEHIVKQETSPDGKYKKLVLVPSAIYGLPTDFDQDVLVVILNEVYNAFQKLGNCPRNIRISLTTFPATMQISKQKYLYDKIVESVKRWSNLEIQHDSMIAVKMKSGKKVIYRNSSLKIFHYKGLYKEEISSGAKKTIYKHYIDLELLDWMRINVNNGNTTEIDVKQYFELKKGRTRKLYEILDYIRYEKKRFISINKLNNDLWLATENTRNRNRALKRSFDELVKIKYLVWYEHEKNGVSFEYSKVKKRAMQIQQDDFFDPIVDVLVEDICNLVGDRANSERFYRKAARICGDDLIYKCLSLTKEVGEITGFKKNSAAAFIDILKRECAKYDIKGLFKE